MFDLMAFLRSLDKKQVSLEHIDLQSETCFCDFPAGAVDVPVVNHEMTCPNNGVGCTATIDQHSVGLSVMVIICSRTYTRLFMRRK